MLKNYFKTAFRNLSRNKVYSLLNVVGLALGIGCSLVIYKVIVFEKSFDKHQSNFSNIYRIVNEEIRPDEIDKSQGTPHPVDRLSERTFRIFSMWFEPTIWVAIK